MSSSSSRSDSGGDSSQPSGTDLVGASSSGTRPLYEQRARRHMLIHLAIIASCFLMGNIALFIHVSTTPLASVSKLSQTSITNSASLVPISVLLFFTAASGIPSPLLFERLGRKITFLIGASLGLIGSIIFGFGAMSDNPETGFYLFCFGALPTGLANGLTNQYRFASQHVVSQDFKEHAPAVVVGAAVLAAVGAPELSKAFRTVMSDEFAAIYFIPLIAAWVILFILLLCADFTSYEEVENKEKRSLGINVLPKSRKLVPVSSSSTQGSSSSLSSSVSSIGSAGSSSLSESSLDDGGSSVSSSSLSSGSSGSDSYANSSLLESQGSSSSFDDGDLKTGSLGAPSPPPRPLSQIITKANFILPCLAATVGYAVMVAVMGITPLDMRGNGFSFDDQAEVIRLHVIGMFLPSFITGFLLKKFGQLPVMAVGFIVLSAGTAVLYSGRYLGVYMVSLCLVGMGWNWSYVSATVRLGLAHHPNEKFKTQAVNDFFVFVATTAVTASSPFIMEAIGWHNFLSIHVSLSGAMIFVVGAMVWTGRQK